jgi:putative membrane protein
MKRAAEHPRPDALDLSGHFTEGTMKTILTTAATILALGVASAQAQSVGEKTGVNSVLGIAPKTDDFVKEVAMSDMFEIQSSQLAQQKASNDKTKQFAEHMVTDHSKTSSELKSMAPNKSVIPTQLDSSHQSKLDKLKSLEGDDFTKQYDSIQASAHKDAVNLFERYAQGGDNAELKDWANRTLPTLKNHLQMAESLNQ